MSRRGIAISMYGNSTEGMASIKYWRLAFHGAVAGCVYIVSGALVALASALV
jgi:hypothetical protein